MATKDTLRDFFLKIGKGDAPLSDEDPLLSSGLLDSLAIVQLLTFIESEFGVTVADVDFDPDNFDSINAIGDLVDRMRS